MPPGTIRILGTVDDSNLLTDPFRIQSVAVPVRQQRSNIVSVPAGRVSSNSMMLPPVPPPSSLTVAERRIDMSGARYARFTQRNGSGMFSIAVFNVLVHCSPYRACTSAGAWPNRYRSTSPLTAGCPSAVRVLRT